MYCDHIESKMPKASTKSVKASYVSYIESFSEPFGYPPRRLDETEISKQLARFGLCDYEIELLLARFLGGKSLEEIAKKFGWVYKGNANYHLQRTIKKLRQGRFKFV